MLLENGKTFKSGLLEKQNIPQIPHIEKKKVNIDVEIDSIKDLIKLAEDYPLKYDVEYNINMRGIHNIKEPLKDLNSMIGLPTKAELLTKFFTIFKIT